jgi:hypothetical protein
MLAQALLGEDYRPDDCDGPKMQRSQPNILVAISNDLIE